MEDIGKLKYLGFVFTANGQGTEVIRSTINLALSALSRHCVPTTELRCRLRLTSIPVQFAQGRLRWFCHAARHPDGELIKDLLRHHLSHGAGKLVWRPAEDVGNHDEG